VLFKKNLTLQRTKAELFKMKEDSEAVILSDSFIQKETDRSAILRSLQWFLGFFNTLLISGSKPKEIDGSQELNIPSSLRRKYAMSEKSIEGIHTYTLQKKLTKSVKHRIYYIAGGGWQDTPSSHHFKFLSKLLHDLSDHTAVCIVSPPLAPKNQAPNTFPVLMEFIKTICIEGKTNGEVVTLAGDSSGGNLVLSITLELLKQNDTNILPHAVVVISPAVDLAHNNPVLPEVEKRDPLLRLPYVRKMAHDWAGSWDVMKDSRISPIHASNLTQLVQHNVAVYGIVGTNDILTPDALIFADSLARSGTPGRWLVYEGCMHCFVLMGGYLKFCVEVKVGFEWVVAVMTEIEQRHNTRQGA
jgi:acetyl esterase/lipase